MAIKASDLVSILEKVKAGASIEDASAEIAGLSAQSNADRVRANLSKADEKELDRLFAKNGPMHAAAKKAGLGRPNWHVPSGAKADAEPKVEAEPTEKKPPKKK